MTYALVEAMLETDIPELGGKSRRTTQHYAPFCFIYLSPNYPVTEPA